MQNQHEKIKGYRDLSQHEIDLMNAIKTAGEKLDQLCGLVDDHLAAQFTAAHQAKGAGEIDRLSSAAPSSWLNDARRDLQVGVMKLTRAVAQPTTF
jgi:hypothetical protein